VGKSVSPLLAGGALCCLHGKSQAQKVSLVPAPGSRQSETALAIARGTARLLRSLGFCLHQRIAAALRQDGADLAASMNAARSGIVEIKSSVEDLRAPTKKWPE
jgi:hypothetical protein